LEEMLPYIVIFAAILYFVLRGLGWIDELAVRRSRRPREQSSGARRIQQAQEEARRLEVYKQFLEGDADPPEEEA
jgi:hypothetical protein